MIGRALLKTAPIIIVDEATSSLHIDSEIAVHRSLLRLMRDRTVIAVAHRLSSIAAFARILVMEGGMIVQEGRPKACRRLRSSRTEILPPPNLSGDGGVRSVSAIACFTQRHRRKDARRRPVNID